MWYPGLQILGGILREHPPLRDEIPLSDDEMGKRLSAGVFDFAMRASTVV